MVNGVMVESPIVAGNTMVPREKNHFFTIYIFKGASCVGDAADGLTVFGGDGVSNPLYSAVYQITRGQARNA